MAISFIDRVQGSAQPTITFLLEEKKLVLESLFDEYSQHSTATNILKARLVLLDMYSSYYYQISKALRVEEKNFLEELFTKDGEDISVDEIVQAYYILQKAFSRMGYFVRTKKELNLEETSVEEDEDPEWGI